MRSDEDAFEGCGEITFTAPANTYAYHRGVELGLIPGPALSVRIACDAASATVGESITWTITCAGSEGDIEYFYEILCGDEVIFFANLSSPQLTFAPTQAGAHTLRVTAAAPNGFSKPTASQAVEVAGYTAVTPGTDFAYETINAQSIRLTAYNGADAHIIVPETIDGYTVQEIGAHLFHNNQTIVSVAIPDTVTRLWNAVFENCDSLVSVQLGHSIRQIDNFAFQGCDNLGSLAFPDSIEKFGMNVAAYCTKLMHVRFPVAIQSSDVRTVAGCPLLKKLILPEGMTAIPGFMFSQCTNLTDVVFPSAVESIGRDALSRCNALTKIDLPANLKTLRAYAFAECHNLAEVAFPYGLETLQTGVFLDNYALVEADLPDSVRVIGEDCFLNCTSLALSSLPDGSYAIRVEAISNGETRCLMTSDFRIFAGAGTLSEETIAALEEFAKKSSNLHIFTTKYAMDILNDMQWIDCFMSDPATH